LGSVGGFEPHKEGRSAKTNVGRHIADAEPTRSRDDIDRHVAKQEENRLAILEDYGRTLGY